MLCMATVSGHVAMLPGSRTHEPVFVYANFDLWQLRFHVCYNSLKFAKVNFFLRFLDKLREKLTK